VCIFEVAHTANKCFLYVSGYKNLAIFIQVSVKDFVTANC
jgi:hypothetical protein